MKFVKFNRKPWASNINPVVYVNPALVKSVMPDFDRKQQSHPSHPLGGPIELFETGNTLIVMEADEQYYVLHPIEEVVAALEAETTINLQVHNSISLEEAEMLSPKALSKRLAEIREVKGRAR